MPQARDFIQDPNLTLGDNLFGTGTDGRSYNYSLRTIADFLLKNGYGDPGKTSLRWEYKGTVAGAGSAGILGGGQNRQDLEETMTIVVNKTDAQGADLSKILETIAGSTIRLGGVIVGQENNYGVYRLATVTENGDFYELQISGGNINDDAHLQIGSYFSITPLIATGSGSSGIYNPNITITAGDGLSGGGVFSLNQQQAENNNSQCRFRR